MRLFRKGLSAGRLLSTIMLLLGGNFLTAQEKFTISGRVTDSATSRPVAYATIVALDEKSETRASGFSNENGRFELTISEAGSYTIEVSFVGYGLLSRRVALLPGQTELALGDMILKTSSETLSEVTVVSRKRIIEVRPGMIVYNAENDLSNKGGTAVDVLRKAPVLNVDAQGNVSMRGSSNLKILVNGKYSGQMARSAADALNMMPAEIIRSVEVITTPSAKYDAEGAAGIINIITKKNRKSFNGAMELTGSNLQQMLNPRVGFTAGKWDISFHGHIHRYRRKESTLLDREHFQNNIVTDRLRQESKKDNTAPHGSADIAIVFTPDTLTEVNIGINTWIGKWPENAGITTTTADEHGSVKESYRQKVDSRDQYLGSDINIGYTRRLPRPGQEITLLAQHSPGRSEGPYHTTLTNTGNIIFYEERNSNKIRNKEWTFQADYIHPLSRTGMYTIETGAKAILRAVNNSYNVEIKHPPADFETDLLRSDNFRYQQDVWAGYVMGKANFKNNWYAEAGVRGERTEIEGRFLRTGDVFRNRFNNLVPTATVSKKINDEHTLTASYTQRLTRPYIWDLNPNANASDPKNISTGNPELQPEIAHQAELAYGLNKGSAFFVNTSLYWKQTDNAILDFTVTDAQGVSVTSKQNLAANRSTGLNVSASRTFSSAFSTNGNVNINYLDYQSEALQIFNDGWAADMDLNLTFNFKKNYSAQAFGSYNTRSVVLQGVESNYYYYGFSGKKEFKQPKLTFTLFLQNPFSAYNPRVTTTRSPQFHSVMQSRYYMRAVQLTINWEFGSSFNGKGKGKRISNDDVVEQGRG
ncbi:MAG: TonB-dependent receptor [Chitinophagaceae bacterium]|nr:TonB-dependent receptor [Chitinophagaceae bacterium]MCW5925284.1 TonB-dependent receptor [Chitinophagaceae bacterium]